MAKEFSFIDKLRPSSEIIRERSERIKKRNKEHITDARKFLEKKRKARGE